MVSEKEMELARRLKKMRWGPELSWSAQFRELFPAYALPMTIASLVGEELEESESLLSHLE